MSSAVLDAGFFHELNLDGLMNEEGYSLSFVRKDGSFYRLDVTNGRIMATLLTEGPVPPPLSGTALAGLELRLKRRSTTGEIAYRSLFIAAVGRTTDYWAKPVGSAPTPPIETYELHVQLDNGDGAYLCQNGVELLDPTSPVRAMPEHHALVLEGKRTAVETLTIAPSLNSRWFNIECAETALAKMPLTGHTKAAQ
jgi:hypothetical protein